MKTSVIRYRVADFLKQHPPFDVLPEEDLLGLCGTGRVAFHESDEYVFRKGEQRVPVISVVQQGRVEIVDETPEGEKLRDVLGEGDMLGLARFLGSTTYRHSARTASDVILYSFDANAFESLSKKHPAIARYLVAHFSITSRYADVLEPTADQVGHGLARTGGDRGLLPAGVVERGLLTCERALPLREVARRMTESHRDAVVVTDGRGRVQGLITDERLRERVATGAVSIDAPAEILMDREFRTAAPGLVARDYVREILRGRGQYIGITADGSAASPLQGLLGASDLALIRGTNPVQVLRGMREAATVEELAYLSSRAEACVAADLEGPADVEWCSALLAEFGAALSQRLVRLAEASAAAERMVHPRLEYCGLFFGKAGRGECRTSDQPDSGIVVEDPAAGRAVREFFQAVARRVEAGFEACGLPARRSLLRANQTRWCGTLSEWKRLYAARVRDPIGTAIYQARELFDFRCVFGAAHLASELRQSILSELEHGPAFIPVLANDTLAHLPPLTFFRGLVIELDGSQGHALDLEKTALGPLADGARVLAFARRDVEVTNTLARLESEARQRPEHGGLLREAAEAFRVVWYHHARAGLANREAGTSIAPSSLGKYDQRLLKTAFGSIQSFLEFTSSRLGASAGG